ncbi:MAG: hypothetical protein JSR15_01425 [Proteobacteria bacterium]|nr:hypothetical protein [Pseudomonadota bacterium]
MGLEREAIVLCCATGLLVGLLVFWLMYRRQRRLTVELASLRTAAAESAARIEELQRYAGQQAQHLTNAYLEREDLLADSAALRRRLKERDNEFDDVIQPD